MSTAPQQISENAEYIYVLCLELINIKRSKKANNRFHETFKIKILDRLITRTFKDGFTALDQGETPKYLCAIKEYFNSNEPIQININIEKSIYSISISNDKSNKCDNNIVREVSDFILQRCQSDESYQENKSELIVRWFREFCSIECLRNGLSNLTVQSTETNLTVQSTERHVENKKIKNAAYQIENVEGTVKVLQPNGKDRKSNQGSDRNREEGRKAAKGALNSNIPVNVINNESHSNDNSEVVDKLDVSASVKVLESTATARNSAGIRNDGNERKSELKLVVAAPTVIATSDSNNSVDNKQPKKTMREKRNKKKKASIVPETSKSQSLTSETTLSTSTKVTPTTTITDGKPLSVAGTASNAVVTLSSKPLDSIRNSESHPPTPTTATATPATATAALSSEGDDQVVKGKEPLGLPKKSTKDPSLVVLHPSSVFWDSFWRKYNSILKDVWSPTPMGNCVSDLTELSEIWRGGVTCVEQFEVDASIAVTIFDTAIQRLSYDLSEKISASLLKSSDVTAPDIASPSSFQQLTIFLTRCKSFVSETLDQKKLAKEGVVEKATVGSEGGKDEAAAAAATLGTAGRKKKDRRPALSCPRIDELAVELSKLLEFVGNQKNISTSVTNSSITRDKIVTAATTSTTAADSRLLEIDRFLSDVASRGRCTPEDVLKVESVRGRLEALIRKWKSGIELKVFGSTFTGLTGPTSDIDMTVILPVPPATQPAAAQNKQRKHAIVTSLHEIEKSDTMKEVIASENSLRILQQVATELNNSKFLGIRKRFLLAHSKDSEKSLVENFDQECNTAISSLQKVIHQIDDFLVAAAKKDPQISMREKLKKELAKLVDIESSVVKNALYPLKARLEKNNYSEIQVVARARVGVIHFTDTNAEGGPRKCDIVINNTTALHNSDLIRTYMTADSTGKVILRSSCCDGLTSVTLSTANNDSWDSNAINQAAEGTLSSYCWIVLCIHFLLKQQLVPNLQCEVPEGDRRECEGLDVSFHRMDVYPMEYLERLETVSLSVLLRDFFGYLATSVDIFESVLTVRGQGEVLRKSDTFRRAVYWRLSIEDPFELFDSNKPHDLGATLTREGQSQVFSAVNKAYNILLKICPDSSDTSNTAIIHDVSPEELMRTEIISIFERETLTAEKSQKTAMKPNNRNLRNSDKKKEISNENKNKSKNNNTNSNNKIKSDNNDDDNK